MNYVWFRMCFATVLILSASCKERPQEYKAPIQVTTVIADAAAPEVPPSLMTAKYCGTHGVAAGMIYNMASKKCECKVGEYDQKLGKCAIKKSEVVYPDRDMPMDSHGPTAEEREEEIALLLKEGPSNAKRWREYDSADAKVMLLSALCEHKLDWRKLGLV